MKTFYIEPIGGLGNRLRALFSAKILADKYGYSLTVNWIENEELNCAFNKLFHEIPGIKFIQNKSLSKLIPSTFYKKDFFDNIKRKLLVKIKYGFDEVLKGAYKDEVKFVKNIEPLLKKGKNIYVKTCESFVSNFGNVYSEYLIPLEKIQQLANKLPINSHTIGLHIRRTDNLMSIEHSSLEKFTNKMSEEIEKNPNVNFYLSTDSSDVENDLLQFFEGKIILYLKDYSRNSQKGIEDALVDIIALSNCSKIFGSFYSSFSEFAATYSGKELIIIK